MRFFENLSDRIDNRHLVIISILIAAGLFLRFYQLGAQSVWFDEATSAIASKSLLETGSANLPSGATVTRALLSKSLIALSFGAFGFSTAALDSPLTEEIWCLAVNRPRAETVYTANN